MTDLLGTLYGIHRAVNELGDLHLKITDLDGMTGAVDRYTRTIHISPGLSLPDTLQVIADGIDVLAPTVVEPVEQIAVGGGVGPGAPAPTQTPRHLRAVPTAHSERLDASH